MTWTWKRFLSTRSVLERRRTQSFHRRHWTTTKKLTSSKLNFSRIAFSSGCCRKELRQPIVQNRTIHFSRKFYIKPSLRLKACGRRIHRIQLFCEFTQNRLTVGLITAASAYSLLAFESRISSFLRICTFSSSFNTAFDRSFIGKLLTSIDELNAHNDRPFTNILSQHSRLMM